MKTSPQRYTKVAIVLHWLIALMIIGQLAGGLYMHKFATGMTKYELYQLHKSFGIVILFLSLARLGWRLTHRPPSLPAGMKPWERMGATFSHFGFYGLMIGVPLVGWIMVSASPLEIPTVLFKVIPWPNIPGIPASEGLEDLMKEVHEILAFATIGLLVLHIAAALKHHYQNKDDVLARMLPFVRPKGS